MNSDKIKVAVIERLTIMLNDVQKNGLCGLNITELDKEDCFECAADALASGDLLACIIYDTCDQDYCLTEEEGMEAFKARSK
jgi:hypothetical protein